MIDNVLNVSQNELKDGGRGGGGDGGEDGGGDELHRNSHKGLT